MSSNCWRIVYFIVGAVSNRADTAMSVGTFF